LAEKEELLVFLKNNLDVFSWSMYDVLGVDLEFICHHLNVNPTIMPKRQPRQSSKEHAEVVKEEVNKLQQARETKEVFYPEWLAL